MKFITIIPAYNEVNTIKKVVMGSLKYSDVLVVDDGSQDGTTDLALKTGARVIKHANNMGKGAAIRTGLNESLNNDYEIMVLIDADCQHDPHYIPSMVRNLGKKEMIICSRFMEGPPQGMAFQRKLSNRLTTDILRYITGYRITDSQCGFRAISKEAALVFLNISYDGYEFESEMLYQASLNDLSVKEMPIPCSYKSEKSYITWVNVLNYGFFILVLILRSLKWRIKH